MISENYFSWRKELFALFQSATETGQLIKIAQQQAESLGYDYFTFLIQHPVPFTRPKTWFFTTYPEFWLEHYQKENFLQIDPIVAMRQLPGHTVQWRDELFIGCEKLWGDAQDAGLISGYSCSVMGANRITGILSLSSRSGIHHRDTSLVFEMKLQYLAEVYLATLERLNDPTVSVIDIGFSRRELEIVKWTAEGKTASEISLILSISEHTVNFHQKNMQKRFNTANKTQIACYAAAIGLL